MDVMIFDLILIRIVEFVVLVLTWEEARSSITNLINASNSLLINFSIIYSILLF